MIIGKNRPTGIGNIGKMERYFNMRHGILVSPRVPNSKSEFEGCIQN